MTKPLIAILCLCVVVLFTSEAVSAEKRRTRARSKVNFRKAVEACKRYFDTGCLKNSYKIEINKTGSGAVSGFSVGLYFYPSQVESSVVACGGLKRVLKKHCLNLRLVHHKKKSESDCFRSFEIFSGRKKHGEVKLIFKYRGYVTIILDDFGHNFKYFNLLEKVKEPVNCAVLPGLAYSEESAIRLEKMGVEVMLHCPMEPLSKSVNPGPGAILSSMGDDEIRDVFLKNLQTVPNAVGVNNHMGSKACIDNRVMAIIIKESKDRGLFFVDSLTNAKSQASKEAKKLKCTIIKRDVFLDNVRAEEQIKKSFDELIRIGRRYGSSVGIGHYCEETLMVLPECVKKIKNNDLKIIPASEMFVIREKM